MSHPFFRPVMVVACAAAMSASAASPASSQTVRQAGPAAASPFLGTWELDRTRMPATYGPPPAQVVFVFADAGAGMWRTTIDITAPDGSVRHMAITYRRDGVAVPGRGDTGEADSAAVLTPAPNVLVMTLGKNRALGSVRVYTVSANGRDMTEAAASLDAEGRPFVRQFHFRRIR